MTNDNIGKMVDVAIETDKSLKDYKIFVFDLDETLYLNNANQIYANEYHRKVKIFLNYLKENEKLLYVATHNSHPDDSLRHIGIKSLFNCILKETKLLNPYQHSIEDYTNKKDMILEILDYHKDLSIKDVVFFDDNDYNIKKVESLNVKCVLVDEKVRINFKEIY